MSAEAAFGIRATTFGETAIAFSGDGALFVGDEASEAVYGFAPSTWEQQWLTILPYLPFKDVPPTGLGGDTSSKPSSLMR